MLSSTLRQTLCLLLLAACVVSPSTGSAQWADTDAISVEETKIILKDIAQSDKLPENEIGLREEQRRIEDIASRTRRALAQYDSASVKGLAEKLETARVATPAIIDEARQLQCPQDLDKVRNIAERIQTSLVTSFSQINSSIRRQPGQAGFVTPGQFQQLSNAMYSAPNTATPTPAEACAKLLQTINNPDFKAGINGFYTQQKQDAQAAAARVDELTSLMDLLSKRASSIRQKLDLEVNQRNIGKDLWLIISLIGGFSVLAMLITRAFNNNIQMEWVATGQVIQFVTVMILLSVIMALGLSGILKENTLGTLLGGIGGYVLAQGVGRAAARDAVRKREESAGGSASNARS